MVESTQVAPWWFNSQTWANIAAVVMVGFAGIQIYLTRKEKRKADDAMVLANDALENAEESNERSQKLFGETVKFYEGFLVSSGSKWASLGHVFAGLNEVSNRDFAEEAKSMMDLYDETVKELNSLRDKHPDYVVVKEKVTLPL